jgi:nucleoside-triphosphatase
MSKKALIVSGPINSGKTTRLMEWCKNRNDVYGILTPKINGKRVFVDVASGEQFEMEAQENEENVLSIGKYIFSVAGFERAKEIVRNASVKKNAFLIIDEVGPLELKGEGFSEELKEMLNSKENSLQVIIVVRESLVNEVVSYFGIATDYEMFTFSLK